MNIIAKLDTLETSDGIRKVLSRFTGLDFAPMETSYEGEDDGWLYTLFVRAEESLGEYERGKGYRFEILEEYPALLDDEEDAYGLRIFSIRDTRPAPAYDKVYRSHEEVKEKLDELWGNATYDEKFVLRDLYRFMEEQIPE